jgi:hypothetical protein
MSLAQISDNSIFAMVADKKYSVCEVEIPIETQMTSSIDSYQLVHEWKNHLMTKKNVQLELSPLFDGLFLLIIKFESKYYEIHFSIEPVVFGSIKSKRLKSSAIVNLGGILE